MNPRGVMARGRRAAERLMVDRCRVTRSGDPVTNPDGTVTTPSVTVYEGKCKLQSRSPWPSTPDAGTHNWTLLTSEVHLPVAVAAVRVGDKVTVLESVDPTNVGRSFLVKAAESATFRTATRLLVEEVTG